jgi:hypothetical protein
VRRAREGGGPQLHPPVGIACGQFVTRGTAGGDGKHLCPDVPAAGDIARGVAHDEDFLRAQASAQPLASARPGDGGEFVAILVIIAERTQRELLPEAEVPQLDLGPQPHVAGQQAHHGGVGSLDAMAHETLHADA